ncbi:hypothetical protein KIPB_016780, partial [Kipferlia bialata]
PPLRKRAATAQSNSDVASDRDRETHTPPTTTPQAQGDTPSETDGMSRTVVCTALASDAVESRAPATERHQRDTGPVTTDPTSETDTHESTGGDTGDSADSGDVLMDGESEESEWEGSESSSS